MFIPQQMIKLMIMKDSFYEKVKRVFDTFPKYHMEILLADFSSKVGMEYISNPAIGNESLHVVTIKELTFHT
jgi:hypothetical protein